MSTVAMTVEGVLKRAGQSGIIPEGATLYWSLAERFNLVLLTSEAPALTEHWLRTNGFRQHNMLLTEQAGDTSVKDTRLRQIQTLRALKHDIAFVVDPDAEIARLLLFHGVTTMLMMHPLYMSPESRPDFHFTPTPWAELVAEVEHQAEMNSREEESSHDR